jgi:hypothetical protein
MKKGWGTESLSTWDLGLNPDYTSSRSDPCCHGGMSDICLSWPTPELWDCWAVGSCPVVEFSSLLPLGY